MATPRKPVHEARLHDRRPETWLTADELQRIAELCAEPLTDEAVRELDRLGDILARYKFALSSELLRLDAAKMAAGITDNRRRDAVERWAKASGLRWRDVHERFGFSW